jgi:hypothetical protein
MSNLWRNGFCTRFHPSWLFSDLRLLKMNKKNINIKSSQSGITLIEVIASLSLMSFVLLGMAAMTTQLFDNTKSLTAAEHTRLIGDAATLFIEDNFAAIAVIATPVIPDKIGVPALIAGGYLPAGFNPANAYGQTACVVVLEPAINQLEALVVTTGGQTVIDGDLAYMADAMGASGGGLFTASPAGPPTNIIGSGGSYQFPRGNFHNAARTCASPDGAGGVNLLPGHPALALWVEQNGFDGGVLYRNAIAGRPELNQMNTTLDLNGNIIINLQAVNIATPCPSVGAIAQDAADGKTLSCQGGNWASVGSNFWGDPVINFGLLPACNAGNTGQTRVVRDGADGVNRPRAYTCTAGIWRPLALDNNGNIVIPGDANISTLSGPLTVTPVALVGGICAPNGRLARLANGEALSCRAGFWSNGKPRLEFVESYIVTQNMVIGKPVCIGGIATARIDIVAQKVSVGTSLRLGVYAVDLGPNWRVKVETENSAAPGVFIPAGFAKANVYCFNQF